jgi:hypothetical protein
MTDVVVTYSRDNPIIAIAVGLLLFFLMIRKPKFFFSVFFLALLLAGIFFAIMEMASSGVSQKEKVVEKGRKQIE